MSLVTLRNPLRSHGPQVELPDDDGSGVLLLSMRQVADLVGYCALYEFEDIVADLTDGKMGRLTNLDGLEFSRKVYKLTRYVTGSPRLAEAVRPTRGSLALTRKYDLFLPVFNHPHELYALNAVQGWRERSRFAACYICEAWDEQIPVYLVELLKDFDHVFVGCLGSIEAIGKITGRPCTYLPMGVDTLKFSPYPKLAPRTIDICGIGRRSRVTHDALLELAQRDNLFYYYDTISSRVVQGGFTRNMTFRVSNPAEHRTLLGNVLKRSRYFIANRAWADKPELTRGKDEIAARFYEGAAAGTIMMGEPPDSEDFRAQFGWEDSVIRMPFDAPRAADVVAELEADTARTARIRRESVVHSLLQHDWVYRVRKILEAADVRPPERLVAREARLRALADEVRKSAGEER